MRQRNNKGVTLIELIIAMAISAIVIGAIIMFMSASSKSYQSQESEISLQMEEQAIMNQINNLVIEGTNISYNGTNQLTIYHSDEDPSTYDKSEVIWFDSTNKKLYLYTITSVSEYDSMNAEISGSVNQLDNLLGEYVENFQVSPSSLTYDRTGSKGSTVTVTLKMKYHDKSYEATQDMKLRNRIVDLATQD